MIPSYYIFLRDFPINSSGKINRGELIKIEPKIYESNGNEKLNNDEKNLKKIICSVLRNRKISKDESLFLAGMDSLDAIKLATLISNKFDIKVSPSEIFENNTIEKLAKLVMQKNKIGNATTNFVSSDDCKYPINKLQQGLFAMCSQNQNYTIYNVPFELKVEKENINIDCLVTAIKETILNNDVFSYRMITDMKSEEIFQLKKTLDPSKIIDEIREVSESEYKKIKKHFVRPFNVTSEKLFRISIFETKTKIFILFDFSHLIFDGSSLYILLDEISKRYNKEKIDKLKISFGEICLIENEKRSSLEFKKAREFFINKFKGDIPVNDFIYDHPRNARKTYEGSKLTFKIKKNEATIIKDICKENNITLNSFFFAMFNIILSKYMYSEDIITGIAFSGRNSEISQKNIIGLFTKTIPIRTFVGYDEYLFKFIKKVQENLANSIENSVYTYEDLVKELNLSRNSSTNPLFNVMFVFQSKGKENITIGNSNVKISAIENNFAKFDLTCEVMPDNTNGEIYVNLEYSSEIFEKETVVRIGKSYINGIKYVVLNKPNKVADVQIVTEYEKKVILKQFNNNKTDYPQNKTLSMLFEDVVKRFPDKKAIVYKDEYLTYEQLNQKSNILAYFLLNELKLKKGDVVALLLDKSFEYVISVLAVLKIGAAYVAITQDLPDERAKYMIENSNSKIILTSKEFDKNISDLPKYFVEEFEYQQKYSGTNLNIIGNIDDLAHIIYTSGSTGLPKGNMIKHRGLIRLVLCTNYIDFNENDVMATTSSLTFDTSGFELWGALLYGMTLHLIKKNEIMDLNYYKNYMKKNNITVTFIPTPIFNQMVIHDWEIFQKLKYIYIGGDVLLPKYTNLLLSHFPELKIYNAYGPAEITVICCSKLVDKIFYSDIPLGKVVSNNEVYILDKCSNICPIGCPGELYVSGDGLGYGYVNREDLTKEKFIKFEKFDSILYKSGDLTLWNKYGEVRYVSRIDNQLKIRGQRVELFEIQNRMLMIDGIKEVYINVVKDQNNNSYLIAYYTITENDITENEIRSYLVKYLPNYMIPYRFVKISEMPLNQNGKIDKSKLPNVNLNENIELLRPQNSIQKKILNIFMQVLNNKNIGMNSDFFENGGDSLNAINLVAKLSTYNIKITYPEIFLYKTPLEVYNFIFNKEEKESVSAGIELENYNKIDDLLSNNVEMSINDINFENKNEIVLLTGVTGFLGVHVLKELFDNGTKKVYCLVRKKDGKNIIERTKNQIKFFFEEKEFERIYNGIEIIEGDITSEKIISNSKLKEKIVKEIDLVINCAASVKHYGDYNKFYNINVNGTKNIVKFCLTYNKDLVHISTLSVSGNIMEGGQIIQDKIKGIAEYDETKFFIGQDLNNSYAYTKFLAEKIVYNAIIEKKLKAKVLRMGNLTGRYNDGKFQPNVEENAFANRLKSIIKLRVFPRELLNLYIEMTPIDYAASAIVRICKISNPNFVTFHLFNDNHAYMPFVLDVFKKLNVNIKIKSTLEVKEIIASYLKDEKKLSEISGIISDINKDGIIEYNENIKIKSNFSNKILEIAGFKWPEITEEYFIKYIEYLKSTGFLKY